MRTSDIWIVAMFAAGLALPSAALAGVFDPNVLNGTFFTEDGADNALATVADLGSFRVLGSVMCRDGSGDLVEIAYGTEAPNKASTSAKSVKVQDGSQLGILLRVDTASASFFGGAIIDECKLNATLKGTVAAGNDTVQDAQVKLTCNLGENFSLLSDGVAPPTAVDLEWVDTLCAGRKDMKVDTEKGTLSIRHNGTPVAQ